MQFGKEPNHSYSRPAVLNGCALAPPCVNLDKLFTDSELIKALKQLKNCKSPKPNGVPNEIWKVALLNSELRGVLRQFLNACFSQGRVPELWEIGEVFAIYKKLDPRNPDNYRPITLLDTIYKIYTRLLADRLNDAVEPYLRSTQYGFRRHRSTTHAIHVVRRTIEGYFHKSEPGHDLIRLE